MSKKRLRNDGTTLVEILVVIVVFAIGILAIAQIFPKGFQILNMNRAAEMATAQAQDVLQREASHPQLLPDGIVPLIPDTGQPDPNFVATSLAFEGLGISNSGQAMLPDGATVDSLGSPLSWEEATAFNNVRGIIGESQPIPAPTLVGAQANATEFYGGLVVLQFGPTTLPLNNTGQSPNLVVYGNDFTRNLGPASASATVNDFEFYYDPYTNSSQLNLEIPTAQYARTYLISFSGYASQALGNPQKRTYSVQYSVVPTPVGQQPSLVTVQLNTPAIVGTDNLTSIDYQSIRVEPVFNQLPTAQTTWSGNPFEVRILNPALGTFLFSPYSYNYSVTRPSGPREALKAKFNYAVKDWRILREDFRVDAGPPSTHQLPIQSLRTSSQPNVDGTAQTGGVNGFGFESLPSDAGGVDHFVLIDLQTGGTYYENYNGQQLITVDKSRGIIGFNSLAGSTTLQGELYLPDGTSETVNMANRPVRALYQARWEWAVQVLKAASTYSVSALTPGVGQFYIGGSSQVVGGLPTRLYFAPCDTGRKVSVGQIWYEDNGNNTPVSLSSQEFVIHPASGGADTTKLPYIDLIDVDANAAGFDSNTYGYAARDVKGSSLLVRVVWNPNVFTLTNQGSGGLTAEQVNAQNEAKWAQSWRVANAETFLDQGVTSR